MRRTLPLIPLLAVILGSPLARADAPMPMLTPGDIKWGDAPPVFPKGATLDAAKSKPFPAGSFVVAPAKVNHFAFAKQAAIVEVSAIGPFAMTYVNPADDPTKSASK